MFMQMVDHRQIIQHSMRWLFCSHWVQVGDITMTRQLFFGALACLVKQVAAFDLD